MTSIDPGMVQTEFSEIRFRGDKERAEKVYQNITPLKPEDVADAIVWAASRPAHVNIHNVVMTTIDQAKFGRLPSAQLNAAACAARVERLLHHYMLNHQPSSASFSSMSAKA